MKKNIFTIILLVILSQIALQSFSQYNPFTNSYTKMPADEPVAVTLPDNLISYDLLSGVPCADSSFWAIASTGADLFTLHGNVITKVGTTVITGPFDLNLAYCNNLNGGGFSPTFYSAQNYDEPVFFNGTGVTASGNVSPDKLINCGGYGNYLYYISYDASFKAKSIVRYTGSAFSTVYNFSSTISTTAADLAVDVYGNVWFFSGPNNGSFQTDTLHVVSPGGLLLNQYPFAYTTDNAYGSFLLGGTIYLGLGSLNVAHPNTVLPITIIAGSATAGTPIAMPISTTYSDMASCTPGSPLSVNEHNTLPGVLVYPVPVSDRLTISNNTSESLEIILYDVTARELLHQYFTNSVTLNTGQFAPGIYLYKIINRTGGEKTGKIVKE